MTLASRCCGGRICETPPTFRVEEHPINIEAINAPATVLTRALISGSSVLGLGASKHACLSRSNHYNVLVLVEGAMTVRCRLSSGVLFLCLCGVAQAFSQANRDVPAKDKDAVAKRLPDAPSFRSHHRAA